MSYEEYTQKLKHLLYCISNKTAVSAIALALKFGVSKRTILRMVETLRTQGVKIKYCKRQKKYFIEN